jgi:phosphodiesterase/alkaline phosphatase D-like protein
MSGPKRFLLPLCAAVIPILALLAPASASATFSYGVQASEVTSSGAVLWAHADSSGPVTAEVANSKKFSPLLGTLPGTASASDDNTVQVTWTGLAVNHRYYYRFKQGTDISATGVFKTAPKADTAATIKFAISGDADAQAAPATPTVPDYNNFEVYTAMMKEKNRFNINLGDTIYSDSEVAGVPVALTVADKWAKYKQNLALAPLPDLRGSAAMYNHWDDHEFVNDFSVTENGAGLYDDGKKAFLNYMAAGYNPTDGLYRKARWGKNLEVFFLDERSFRSSKATTGGDCDFLAVPGLPDLAPTAPQPTRTQFAALIPPLAAPVKPTCLPRINDPGRTMLGTAQLAKFKADVAASTARFKIIMTETPIQEFFALPYDRWEGYAAERTDLINYLKNNVKNVMFMATDTHANMVNDVRLTTLPLKSDSGITEVVTGPVATKTFTREINEQTGNPAAGELIRSVFFKAPPPFGPGMKCAATDNYSYSEVKVLSGAVIITPKDKNRVLVREPDGTPCGPFVIKYQP